MFKILKTLKAEGDTFMLFYITYLKSLFSKKFCIFCNSLNLPR